MHILFPFLFHDVTAMDLLLFQATHQSFYCLNAVDTGMGNGAVLSSYSSELLLTEMITIMILTVLFISTMEPFPVSVTVETMTGVCYTKQKPDGGDTKYIPSVQKH